VVSAAYGKVAGIDVKRSRTLKGYRYLVAVVSLVVVMEFRKVRNVPAGTDPNG